MNTKVILLVLTLVFCGWMLATNIDTGEHYTDSSRPSDAVMPTKKVPNDKIILIRNASYDQVKQAVTEFLNDYNQKRYQMVVELKQPEPQLLAITFPYNLRFNTYLYFIHYLQYPRNLSYDPEITAWDTALTNDQWITPDLANKKIILYLPKADDNTVLVTADDGISYKMGYAFKGQIKKLNGTPLQYRNPEATQQQLKDIKGETLH